MLQPGLLMAVVLLAYGSGFVHVPHICVVTCGSLYVHLCGCMCIQQLDNISR
jgi:hypothetical protein